MSRQTRKLMWTVPLIAAVAVIGALALFLTLMPNDASAQGANVEIPPGQPVGLTAEAYDEGTEQEEILLDWSEPTDGGSAPARIASISPTNGGYTWVALESDFRGTSYTHDGLLANETHHYRVFALNQHGISVVSDIAERHHRRFVGARTSHRPRPPKWAPKPAPRPQGSRNRRSIWRSRWDWDEPVDPDGAPVKRLRGPVLRGRQCLGPGARG